MTKKSLWLTLSDEQRMDKLKECRAAGLTGDRMATACETTKGSISAWLTTRRMKLSDIPLGIPEDGTWGRMPEPARRQMLEAAIAKGIQGYSAIGRHLGTRHDKVRLYAQRYGIEVPAYHPVVVKKVFTPKPVRLPPKPTELRDFPHKKHLLETKRLDCRFPLWGHDEHPRMDTMYVCGAPVEHESTSYCAECRDVTLKVRLSTEESQKLAVRAGWLRRGVSRPPG